MDQKLPIRSQEGGPGKIHFEYQAAFIESEIAGRGEIIQVGIPAPRSFELLLGPAQLFVLHFELDLVGSELVGETLHVQAGNTLQPFRLVPQPLLRLPAERCEVFFGPLFRHS